MTREHEDAAAAALAAKLNNPNGIRFYTKCVQNLSEGEIQKLLEKAYDVGRNPAYYFSKSASNALKKKGIEA